MTNQPDSVQNVPGEDRNGASSPWTAAAAFVCGLLACALNMLLITAPVGMILGTLALLFGAAAFARRRRGQAGLVLAAVSYLIVCIWGATIAAVIANDPTFAFGELWNAH